MGRTRAAVLAVLGDLQLDLRLPASQGSCGTIHSSGTSTSTTSWGVSKTFLTPVSRWNARPHLQTLAIPM
jgi:hypothetical protein